jgi:hypothetical protein
VAHQRLGDSDPSNFQKAKDFHSLHSDISDLNGKFLSAMNLGMIAEKTKDGDGAQMYH